MNQPSLWNRLVIGVKRHPIRVVVHVFLSYSVGWSILEPLVSFIPGFTANGTEKYVGLVVFSLGMGVILATPRLDVAFVLQGTNTRVSVVFGDLFEQPGWRVIAVSEFFDSAVGRVVAPTSLHGKFITSQLGGDPALFNKLVRSSLKGQPSKSVTRTSQGAQTEQYPIGTTAVAELKNGDKYFLVALARIDLTSDRAKADVPELWTALTSLWAKVRESAGGESVNVPLIGGGLSGVGLSPMQLLYVMITSILTETKKDALKSNVRIVLPPGMYDEIDMEVVEREWR